jgi:hypothetical protein
MITGKGNGGVEIGREGIVPAEKESLRRVREGLYQLQSGLGPFVEQQLKASYGADWLKHASNTKGSSTGPTSDSSELLTTMLVNWKAVFAAGFPKNKSHKIVIDIDGAGGPRCDIRGAAGRRCAALPQRHA